MTIADHNIWSTLQQLLVTLGVVLVALIPVLVSQNRLHRKADRTYEHVNNVEVNEAVPDGEEPTTLGGLLRHVERKMDDGFRRNDDTHDAIIRVVDTQGELLHDHGRRLDAQRQELDRLWGEMRHIRQRPPVGPPP